VPKAFVNLVDSTELMTSSLACQDDNDTSNPGRSHCNCTGGCSALHDHLMRWFYQDAWEKLLESERFDQEDDFAVIFQPSLQERNLLLRLGRDGFITTSKMEVETLEEYYTSIAVGLWNNMMEPVGQKQPYGTTKMLQVKCPSQENPYLFTYGNSNYSSSPETSNTRETPQERIYGTNIPCSDWSSSDTVPVSVHSLKPADIRVIAALGDSITAGNGAASKPQDVLDVLTQYRGVSWSVGGNENISTVTTLANILREFNPSLIGYSTGTGRQTSENAALNQAVAGAHAEDLPAQASQLVQRMKNDTRINLQTDWKLITVFIGGNDLCQLCKNPAHYSPENYTYNIQLALDVLHREVPRAFVNLVTVLSIASLRELHASKNTCPKLLMRSLCPCVIQPQDDSNELKQLVYFNRRYQERTRQLVESGRYDTTDDFTVVMQPFLINVDVPKTEEGLPDKSFFAPDCFHFSQKGHSQAARALWNSMLEPLGEKTDNQRLEEEIVIKCPSDAEPFLRTYKNSLQNYGSQLLCEDRSPSSPPPTSVHSLKPADMQIVAALGDSLTRIDFSADWKLITVQIGSNDLCNYCKDPVPKALVSLVNVVDILSLRQLFVDTAVQCPTYMAECVFQFLRDWHAPVRLRSLLMPGCSKRDKLSEHSLGVQRLVESGRYDTHENFTVVIQPFLQNLTISLGQIQPVGQKADSFDLTADIVLDCPAQTKPFLRTYRNSNYTYLPVEPTDEPTEKINFKEDWKLITVFVGGNDLCQYCLDKRLPPGGSPPQPHLDNHRHKVILPETYSAQKYVKHLQDTLDLLYEELPRVFVNVVEMLELSVLRQIAASSPGCAVAAEVLQLIYSGRYGGREDFAAVVQPFFRNTLLPLDSHGKPDLSFFAADCFHFSRRGYAEMAVALWNNMLDPVGEKQTYNNFTHDRSKPRCPNLEKPFLSTLGNSDFRNSDLSLEEGDLLVPYWAVIVAAVAGAL
ncbi:PREDICTED: phospholipase B1, membrane-associated, partial [Buceros rhinoceros silvestris]|uniref:phospholipase B1, membrane-associated n=1 Tax=Buceros rhinoceros silvestris TaxID=175836 RepID=UPI000528BAAA